MPQALRIWECKVGEAPDAAIPDGGDVPMRKAVEEAFFKLTGQKPNFLFSGWGGELTECERAVVENREPRSAPKPFNPMQDIREFHEKFRLDYNGPPREIPEELAKFRLKFIVEELVEYTGGMPEGVAQNIQYLFEESHEPALSGPILADKLDALVDLMYVLLGTAYLHGFGPVFEVAWRRVHAANMMKTRVQQVDESKRASIYDVVKPEGWRPPSLLDLVAG